MPAAPSLISVYGMSAIAVLHSSSESLANAGVGSSTLMLQSSIIAMPLRRRVRGIRLA